MARDKTGNALRDAIKARGGSSSASLTSFAKEKKGVRGPNAKRPNPTMMMSQNLLAHNAVFETKTFDILGAPLANMMGAQQDGGRLLSFGRHKQSAPFSMLPLSNDTALMPPARGQSLVRQCLQSLDVADMSPLTNMNTLSRFDDSMGSLSDVFDSDIFEDTQCDELEPRPLKM